MEASGAERDRPIVAPSTSAPHSSRLPFVQGLRAVAVLLVVIYHAGLPLRGGYVGVDVFFVISGFVITALLIRELDATGRLRLGRFYARRIRRLLPALSLMLCVTLIGSMLLQSPFGAQQSTAITAGGASLWLANAALYLVTGGYFDASPASIPLLHTWSLAVEEQFYLVFPVVIIIGFWLGRRVLRGRPLLAMTVFLVAVSVVSFALLLLLSFTDVSGLSKARAVAFYSAPTRAWEFAAGGLVAVWWAAGRPWVRGPAVRAGWIGAAAVIGAGALIPSSWVFPGVVVLVPVLGTVLLLVAGLTGAPVIVDLLSRRPMTWLGDLSYSWYLWHWPLIAFAAVMWPGQGVFIALAALVALPVAYAAYRLVEQPLRVPRPGRRRVPVLALAAVSVSVPLALSAVLYQGAERSWGDAQIDAMGDQVRPLPLGYSTGCHSAVSLGLRDQATCTIGADRPGAPIVLIGDSNAGQYADALLAAAEELDQPLTLGTMSACPFVDVIVTQPGVDWTECRDFVTASTAWLTEQPPSVVVTASANAMISLDPVVLIDPETGERASTREEKAELWAAGLERSLRALKEAGHSVVLVNVIPHLMVDGDATTIWNPSTCRLGDLRHDVNSCSQSFQRADLDLAQELGLEAEHRAARALDIIELDLRDELCWGPECSAVDGTRWLYRDGMHITTAESVKLAPRFVDVLTDLRSRSL